MKKDCSCVMFCIEEPESMIQSPLNYTGGKFKLLPQILPLFPANISTFVDLFCGGCNVGINVDCQNVIYNDLDTNLLYLYNTFKILDKQSIFEWIYEIINTAANAFSSGCFSSFISFTKRSNASIICCRLSIGR